jgi:Methane oxygenase PmoA
MPRNALELRLDGQLVGIYHHGPDLARPYLAPLLDAAGRPVTADPGPADHPHHRGVWIGHRDVGGVDHWTEFAGHGRIAHRGFDEVGTTIRERLDWLDPQGRPALAERRLLRVHPGPVLDLAVHLSARDAVTLGANKDASLAAVRVAPSMTTIENAAGAQGEDACWGRRAAWCDFSGPAGGIAVLDHPGNPRHPSPWHVRAYGLLAPNPFLDEPLRLEEGGEVAFRYRLVVHEGRAASIGEHYRAFAAEAA